MQKLYIYLCLLVIAKSYSQELNLPVFTQYLAENNFVVSPSYAGIGDNLKIRANGLAQWVGIKDAPENQSLYADFRIADRSGIGVSLYNDSNGFTLQKGAKFSFAHHLILDYYSKQYLSFGISYNINSFRLDIAKFEGYNPNTGSPFPTGVTDDRATSNNNFDVGFLYRNRGFFLSFNANNILPKNFDDFVRQLEPDLLINYQIYSGYTFRGPKKSGLEFEPSIYYQLFASDNRSGTDVNFKFRKFSRNEDYYWAGIAYRFLNDQFFKPLNIGPMAGFKKSKFYFGYAYQITTNALTSFNSGTHMVTIGFDFLRGISNCPCTQSPIH
ncbi:PorP/SprF family type IX secretion system membrane protein [Flavivirga jejuensis]|uniref:Type IX secretion system membrane protein PorP/SprF n=1 Tax=Flavivirga jejuensis TaxID=870487 RepID=A0ABT8WT52_9FLAO|nr:type IX secretion system membrane protein PorP/SprF [Flavivirga jejuensis]MDO5976180.1 type IX secretion system membrane protein PorP/SprF [Flavivirga jejuensis]